VSDGAFQVEFARDGVEALDRLKVFEPDVVTLDVHMPKMDGLACLDRIMVEQPSPVVMVASLTSGDADATLEAFRLGAVDFVAKPTGAPSLHMAEWGPGLVVKVRNAAGAKLRSSLRLRDRVRHRVGGGCTTNTRPDSRAETNDLSNGRLVTDLSLSGSQPAGRPLWRLC
jgi:two-component system chemotaxis response regulator CheB